ncbi:MAG: universal stress protein [Bacteroidetes bacterium]|nr:universal stress protein [Bacteroidota bacterium]
MEATVAKILVGFDHSPSSTVALEKGLQLAKRMGAELHIVYVEATGHFLDWDSVHDYVAGLRRDTGMQITEHHKKGKAYREIVHTEKEIGADLILVGTHGIEGFTPFWIGSTAYRVVSSSKCPVITVQENSEDLDFSQILLPLDSTPETRQKLPWAALLAKKFHSTIHILCVSKDKDDDTLQHLRVYAAQTEEYLATRGIRFTTETRAGANIAQECIKYSRETHCGLVMMMTETEPSGMFMGTVAQQLINHCPIPVMAIHNRVVVGVIGGGY